MAVVSGQVACPSNTTTAIIAAANSNATYVGSGTLRTVVLTNPSATGVWIGGTSAVTSATGFLLASNATVTLSLAAGDALFGRGASLTPTVYYLATGS